MLININITCLENIIVNMLTRVLIINNYNLIALLMYTSFKTRVNRIVIT